MVQFYHARIPCSIVYFQHLADLSPSHHNTFIDKLIEKDINPDEFVKFLRESLRDARHLQEIKNSLLTPRQQIELELRPTKMEYLLVMVENERAKMQR